MKSFKEYITEVSHFTLARYIAGRVNQKPLDLRKNRKKGPAEKRESMRRQSTSLAWGKLYKKVGQKKGDEMVRMARKGIPLNNG